MLAFAVPVLAGLALTRRRRVALAAASLCLLSAADMARHWSGPATRGGGSLTLYQKNLLFAATRQADLEADIAALDPDVLTFQEVAGANLAMVQRLRIAYPHVLSCPWRTVGGPAILSRHPFLETGCPVAGLALALIDRPDGPVRVASLHLEWPWPLGQEEQLGALLPVLRGLDGPTILAGDFNMVPWGAGVRRVAEAGRMERLGGYARSLDRFGPLVFLPIDHVLIPEGGAGHVETRPPLGSDHLGLLARIGLPGR